MSDLNNFKKADLLSVARKVGLHVLAKDTKKVLIEKLNAFIEENPDAAVEAIRAVEQSGDDDDDEEVHTLVEDSDDEETDKDDKDYDAPPPIDIKSYVVDPIIKYSECARSKFLELTDKVGITTTEFNEELREQLSGVVTLNFLELLAEVSYFLFYYVPLVPIKDNDTIHQVFKDNFDFFATSTFPLPDVTELADLTVFFVFLNWFISAVAVPLIISYYVNFSRRIIFLEDDGIMARIYKFDPFTFAVAKLIIFYFVVKNGGSLTTLSSYKGIFNALKNHFLIQLGIYSKFAVSLGNFPIAIGAANIALAIYAQFEDY